MIDADDGDLRGSQLELLAILAGASPDPAHLALSGNVQHGHAALLARHGGADAISARVGQLRAAHSSGGAAVAGVGEAKHRLSDDDHRGVGALRRELEEATAQLERYEQELADLRAKVEKKDAKARRQARSIKELEATHADTTEHARQLEAEWSHTEARLRAELSDAKRDLLQSQSELRQVRDSVHKPDVDGRKQDKQRSGTETNVPDLSTTPGRSRPSREALPPVVRHSEPKPPLRLRDLAKNRPLQPNGDDIHRLLTDHYFDHSRHGSSRRYLGGMRPLIGALNREAKGRGVRLSGRDFLPNKVVATVLAKHAALDGIPDDLRDDLDELLKDFVSEVVPAPGSEPRRNHRPEPRNAQGPSQVPPRLFDLAREWSPLDPDRDNIHRLLVQHYRDHEQHGPSRPYLKSVRPLLVSLDAEAKRRGLRERGASFRDERGFLPNQVVATLRPKLAAVDWLREGTRQDLDELLGRVSQVTDK